MGCNDDTYWHDRREEDLAARKNDVLAAVQKWLKRITVLRPGDGLTIEMVETTTGTRFRVVTHKKEL